MSDSVERSVLSLEEKHLISIMMFLSINGQCRKIDVYENVSTNPRIPEKLDRLEAMGLITQSRGSNQKSVIIALTEKGKVAAERIMELDRIIKSD